MAGNGVKNEYMALGADVDQMQTEYIFMSGLKMLGIALLGSLAAMASAFLSSRVGAGFARDLRHAVFKKVESFSNSEFNKFSTASLITRTTNDITQVQMLMIMLLRIVLFAPMMGVGALIKAFTHSSSMTWIILMILIVISVVIIILMKVVLPKFKIIQSLIDRLNLTMRENLLNSLLEKLSTFLKTARLKSLANPAPTREERNADAIAANEPSKAMPNIFNPDIKIYSVCI